jgi:hypothetical protein
VSENAPLQNEFSERAESRRTGISLDNARCLRVIDNRKTADDVVL